MATISEALSRAFQLHRDGRIDVAERLCRQILDVVPNQADALHLLGIIAIQAGRYELAANLITRAVELSPNESSYRVNLGSALRGHGKLDEAIACFQKALTLKPDYAEAHNNLGATFEARGDLQKAEKCYRQAIGLRPAFAEAYNNLGNILQIKEEIDEAADCFQRTLELSPNHAEAHSNLANVLLSQGKTEEAMRHCRQALELKPDFAEAFNNLGNVLQTEGKHDEAVKCYRSALTIRPTFAEGYTNLGIALTAQDKLDEAMVTLRRAWELKPDYALTMLSMGNVFYFQGKYTEGIACYRKALELKPNFAEAYFLIGNTLKDEGRTAEALDSYDAAIDLSPDYAEAHGNRSLLLLQRGDFERGWTEYEWRWKTKQLVERQYTQPKWDGSPLSEEAILLYAEQGLGDTFQFIRYTALVKESNPAASVVVECQRPLAKLLMRCASIDRLIAEGDALPPFDVQSPLLSLPRVFRTTSKTIPANVPYLFADSDLVAEWAEKLAAVRGFRIGINWQGRTSKGGHRKRDIPLACFAQLASIPGVSLISMQVGKDLGEPVDKVEVLPVHYPGPDFDTIHGAFMDTAALMMNVDLVITSDTSIPHLAGGLGVPVWIALPNVSDWRWLLERTESPWYPTMRLFRQRTAGDWEGVFKEMQVELQNLLGEFSGTAGQPAVALER